MSSISNSHELNIVLIFSWLSENLKRLNYFALKRFCQVKIIATVLCKKRTALWIPVVFLDIKGFVVGLGFVSQKTVCVAETLGVWPEEENQRQFCLEASLLHWARWIPLCELPSPSISSGIQQELWEGNKTCNAMWPSGCTSLPDCWRSMTLRSPSFRFE